VKKLVYQILAVIVLLTLMVGFAVNPVAGSVNLPAVSNPGVNPQCSGGGGSPSKYATTTKTILSDSTINLGQSVTDTAVVTSQYTKKIPGGKVTFQVSSNGGKTFKTFGSVKTLNNQGRATSDSYTPASAGTYYFRAVYAGNEYFKGSQSGAKEEPLCVKVASRTSTTTSTRLSAFAVFVGQSVTDTAFVKAKNWWVNPTGTVTFQVSTDGGRHFNDFGEVKTLNDGRATSDAYITTAAGTLYFRAVYSGDDACKGSQSGIKEEPLCVKNVPNNQKLWSTKTTDL